MKQLLVAYFSVTGTTQHVAEQLAAVAGADIIRIMPETAYTEADLNWQNKASRSSVEMQDTSSRPPFIKEFNSIDEYDVVFVGFPIWWYREPSIIDTFLEAYDFTGKKVVPFCTSGGSNLGESPERMQSIINGGKVAPGKRFNWNASNEDIANWVAKYQ